MMEAVNAACRESFDCFAMRAFNEVEPGTAYEWNWHIGCIAEHLEAARNGELSKSGELTKLVFNMPPRTLKSWLIPGAFPAWEMGHNPSEQFITASYGKPVSLQNSVRCKAIVKSDWYRSLFPETRIGSLDTKTEWQTTKNGQYYATTSTSAITGKGCRFMILDDPIKPMEAHSETIRASINENIRSTMFSRFNDPRTGVFILVMQRVHEDDPTGHLLQDEGWHHVKLPAEAKRPLLIRLGKKHWTMKAGEMLFPKRLTPEFLEEQRTNLGPYNYSGQMQQEPVPMGGGEFDETWVQYYKPGTVSPAEMNIYILVDPAGGEELNKRKKKLSDWTAMMVIGCAPDNNYYLLDIVRDRLNPTDRVDTLFTLHRKWNALTKRPPKVGYESYGMMTDIHYIKEKQNDTGYRFRIEKLGGQMMKEERIRRMIPDMQNGRWYYPASLMYTDSDGRTFDLVQELIKSEQATFPKARFDDMLDAKSRIYDEDLGVVFPKLKKSSVKADYRTVEAPRQPQSWEDF